jgi:hypothetical protein
MSKTGVILATRFDRRETDFVVLERITDGYQLYADQLTPVDIEKNMAMHRAQTRLLGSGPLYRHVWFQAVTIPK